MDSQNPIAEWFPTAARTIFSWVVLMPVAVIVSGKLLNKRIKFSTQTKQLFRIPFFGFFELQANGGEVIMGFTGFLITLFIFSVIAGKMIYTIFKYQFGIDPGHFNSLCIFCSFATVVWSALFYIISAKKASPLTAVSKEHEKLINEIYERLKEDN